MEHSAQAEAIDHLHQALALLDTLPETPERNQQELQLQIALGAPLIGAKGYGDPELERVYDRARELCQAMGERPELIRALLGLGDFHLTRGRLVIAAELAEQALALAVKRDETYLLLEAHNRLGVILYWQGELTRGHEHLEQAVALYDPAEHRSLASAYGQDTGITSRSQLTHTLWQRGYPERALRLSRETVELAREGDPYSLAFALTSAGMLADWLGDRERVLEYTDEAIGISREGGYPVWLTMAISFRSVALGGSRGLEELQQNRTGAAADPLGLDLLLARINLELGRTADALALLDARLARQSEVHYLDVSVHHLRGSSLLQQGDVDEAERCFRRALEIAREQKAKSFELGVATSLAQLLLGRGERDGARAALAPVYDWFTEGFDTKDLKDAKALLDELA
jgi:adenylate cyclase